MKIITRYELFSSSRAHINSKTLLTHPAVEHPTTLTKAIVSNRIEYQVVETLIKLACRLSFCAAIIVFVVFLNL